MEITKNNMGLFSLIKEKMSEGKNQWEDLGEINYLGWVIVLQPQTPSGEWQTRGQIEITVYNHNKLIDIENTIEQENKTGSYYTDLQCDEYYVRVYDCVVKMINYLDENYNNELAGNIKTYKNKIKEYTIQLQKLQNEWKLKNK